MGLPNNVRVAMAIKGRTHEFVRCSHGKCGCCRRSSTGLWLTCLTVDPKCTGTFWAVSTRLWLMCLTFESSPTHSHDETLVDQFNVTMVMSSSSLDDVLLIGVRSEAGSQTETNCLHLFAVIIRAAPAPCIASANGVWLQPPWRAPWLQPQPPC